MKKLLITAILSQAIIWSNVVFSEETNLSPKDTVEKRTLINTRHSIKDEVVNSFEKSSGASKVLWQMERYTPVIVVDQKDGWVRVKDFEGDLSWIKDYQLTSEKTIITKKRSNIRSGPGPENEILFYSLSGVPYKVLGSEGNWINIQHANNKKGWIYKPLVW